MTLGPPIWITDKSGGICIWKWVGNLNLSDLSLQMIWWRTSGRSLHNIMPRITNISLPSEEFPYCPGLKMSFPICNLTCFTGDLYLCKHLWTYTSISLCCRLIGLKQKQFITSYIPVSGLVVLPRGLVPWGHNLLWPHSKSCSSRAEMSPPLPTWVLPPFWKFSENVLSSKVLRDPGCKRGWLPALGFCSPLLSKLHKQTRTLQWNNFHCMVKSLKSHCIGTCTVMLDWKCARQSAALLYLNWDYWNVYFCTVSRRSPLWYLGTNCNN